MRIDSQPLRVMPRQRVPLTGFVVQIRRCSGGHGRGFAS
jgi:hypothetical protein